MTSPSVLALEGLPGAGKTSLLLAIGYRFPGVRVVSEMVLAPPSQPNRDFFVANDIAKLRRSRGNNHVVMDRCWISTVSYVAAESHWHGGQTNIEDIVADLYPRRPAIPTTCLFIDSAAALACAFATDGLFADLRFRTFLRQSYYNCFDHLGIPVRVVLDNSSSSTLPVISALLSDHRDIREGELTEASQGSAKVGSK